MAVRALDIPDGTLQAIQQLADITGVEDRDRLAKLLLDALRTYEWILYQQVTGKIVAALGQPEVELLEHTEEIDVDREFLTSLIAPGRQNLAREYFAAADR